MLLCGARTSRGAPVWVPACTSAGTHRARTSRESIWNYALHVEIPRNTQTKPDLGAKSPLNFAHRLGFFAFTRTPRTDVLCRRNSRRRVHGRKLTSRERNKYYRRAIEYRPSPSTPTLLSHHKRARENKFQTRPSSVSLHEYYVIIHVFLFLFSFFTSKKFSTK